MSILIVTSKVLLHTIHLMRRHVVSLCKTLVAEGAFVWFLPSMCLCVSDHIAQLPKLFIAILALKLLLSTVYALVGNLSI